MLCGIVPHALLFRVRSSRNILTILRSGDTFTLL